MRRLAYALAILTTSLALCASAQAAVNDPEINAYVRVAAAYFGPLPQAPNGPDIETAEMVPGPNIWAAARIGSSTIWLDPTWYPRPADVDSNFWAATMCSVVVHEYGHLAGLDHSSDPRDIMNPTPPLNLIPGCPAYFRESDAPSSLHYKPTKKSRYRAYIRKTARKGTRERDVFNHNPLPSGGTLKAS